MKITSTINGVHGQWTVTDSHLNADNSALIYSSLVSMRFAILSKTF